MWIQPGALLPVPGYGVVGDDGLAEALRDLGAGHELEAQLARSFRRLETEQPALASLLAHELCAFERPSAQALLYFLYLVVFRAFRAAFGARLHAVETPELEAMLE